MKFFQENICAYRSIYILICVLNIAFEEAYSSDGTDLDKELELGKKLLAAGQLADALMHYDNAIGMDPKNYMTYFRRATVYMALGKAKSALPDLQKVIELKPDFVVARQHRAGIYVKQGDLENAKKDYNSIIQMDPSNEEAKTLLNTVNALESYIAASKNFYSNHNFVQAEQNLNKAIELAPWSYDLRAMRAECYAELQEIQKGILDLRSLTKLANDNTGDYLKLAKMLYDSGDAEQALIEIRECLKLDPDHKSCFTLYKDLKKLVKLMENVVSSKNDKKWTDCVEKTKKLSAAVPVNVLAYTTLVNTHLCTCLTGEGNYTDAIEHCSAVIEAEPSNFDAFCDRAEAYLDMDKYDDAIRDYQKVLEADKNHVRAKEGLNKAQKLLKQSQSRDYYKILGVSKKASKQEILKAYRKLAAKFHPDQYKGPDKEKAERRFIDISDAKEVLSDAEKRAKFDSGEDPLDPEQQHHGHNPFGGFTFHNFNPFGQGGGGFQYEFHFG